MKSFRKRVRRLYIADEIRQQIQAGELRPDDYLLPERQLAKHYAVSMRVVRTGLARLAAEGWIRRQRGSGTVVLARPRVPSATRPKNVALVISGRIRDTSTAELCDGIQQGLQQQGIATLLHTTDRDPEKEAAIVKQLVEDGVPGAILFSTHSCSSFGHLAQAKAAGMRLVTLDHYFPGFECDSVCIDDQLGAFEATSHLIRLGCASLLHVTADTDWTSVALRRKGFEAAAARSGRAIEARIMTWGDSFSPEMAKRELLDWMKTAARPAGVFAVNDSRALQVMEALREGGYRLPGDARVVGFNNDLEGALAEVPLTTVEVPREEIAKQAVQCLMEQFRGEKREAARICVKPRLIIRQSCGCYPAVEDGVRDGRRNAIRRMSAPSGAPAEAASVGRTGLIDGREGI